MNGKPNSTRTLHLRSVLSANGLLFVALLVILNVPQVQAQSNTHPAMIVNGSDSVAAQLHYPPKAKAAKRQAAIPFYCEVGTNGKPDHLQLYGPTDCGEFRIALLAALRKGRFQPAVSGGQAVPVIVGGTAFFMFRGNEPVIAVTLSTANREKTASLANYIQPQMISSSAQFRRKIWQARFDPDIHLRPGVHPGAVGIAEVDAQGNLLNTKITAESPANSGWGPLLLKGFKGAKFIPAFDNGKPVAGKFDITVNYDDVYNPDEGPVIGSHINRDDYDR
jgi:hypothetical protein